MRSGVLTQFSRPEIASPTRTTRYGTRKAPPFSTLLLHIHCNVPALSLLYNNPAWPFSLDDGFLWGVSACLLFGAAAIILADVGAPSDVIVRRTACVSDPAVSGVFTAGPTRQSGINEG